MAAAGVSDYYSFWYWSRREARSLRVPVHPHIWYTYVHTAADKLPCCVTHTQGLPGALHCVSCLHHGIMVTSWCRGEMHDDMITGSRDPVFGEAQECQTILSDSLLCVQARSVWERATCAGAAWHATLTQMMRMNISAIAVKAGSPGTTSFNAVDEIGQQAGFPLASCDDSKKKTPVAPVPLKRKAESRIRHFADSVAVDTSSHTPAQ